MVLQRIKNWFKFKYKGIKAWYPCNIYSSAKIGVNVSIGMYTEIGNNVHIGSGTRIGKGSFIPEGVYIGKDCFIGPHVCFSNDMFPPTDKSKWQKTIIADKVSIGASVSIRPGVLIGYKSMVGMGAVVTKDIPAYELWVGVPARKLKSLIDKE